LLPRREAQQAALAEVLRSSSPRSPAMSPDSAATLSTSHFTMLPSTAFLELVDSAPLVAIDLIIENREGRYLLGRRINRPAQGFWFVPGGRIQKNESLDDAFRRIGRDELGCVGLERTSADLLGVFEHFYADNFSGRPGISTHYVVLGYRLCKPIALDDLPKAQHSAYRWATAEEIRADVTVHGNTRAYFVESRILSD
jgi:colanic acid biosynthesis protein WcaH